MVWPAIIAAGAAIGGGLLAGQQSKAGAKGTAFTRARDDSAIQRKAADARAAGLHPLFALGSTGGYTQSTTGFSGSHMGEGVARAGQEISRGMQRAQTEKVNASTTARLTAEHDLRLQKMQREIQLDDMELLRRSSDLKRAEQGAMWGDWNPGITGGGQDVMTYPYGTKSGPPLNMRPLTAEGRRSIPRYVEQVGPKGRRRAINPELGLDEEGQAFDIIDPYQQYLESFWNSSKFRPTMKNPRAFYHYWKQRYKRRRK